MSVKPWMSRDQALLRTRYSRRCIPSIQSRWHSCSSAPRSIPGTPWFLPACCRLPPAQPAWSFPGPSFSPTGWSLHTLFSACGLKVRAPLPSYGWPRPAPSAFPRWLEDLCALNDTDGLHRPTTVIPAGFVLVPMLPRGSPVGTLPRPVLSEPALADHRPGLGRRSVLQGVPTRERGNEIAERGNEIAVMAKRGHNGNPWKDSCALNDTDGLHRPTNARAWQPRWDAVLVPMLPRGSPVGTLPRPVLSGPALADHRS